MALIKCNECGREISSKALHCIGCGAPLENLQKNDQVINKSNDDDLNANQNNHEKNKKEDISNLPREERIKKIIAEKKAEQDKNSPKYSPKPSNQFNTWSNTAPSPKRNNNNSRANRMDNINMFTAISKTFQFAGRSTRKEYWLYFLLSFTVSFFIGVYEYSADPYGLKSIYIHEIIYIGLIPTTLCVNCRRLHDVGKSGWGQLILFVPIIGFVMWLVWFTRDGNFGNNMYGPDPKG